MNKNVFVFGSLNADISVVVDLLPKQGETVFGENLLIGSGGKGANQAVAASRAGAKTYLVGSVGADAFGDELLRGLAPNGVDIGGVRRKDAPTGLALILLSEGDNRIVIHSGANGKTSAEDAEFIFEKAKENDILLSQLEVKEEEVSKVFASAKRKNMFTILNPTPARKIPPELFANTDLLVLNETECEFFVARRPSSSQDLKDLYPLFSEMGVKRLLVTLGSKGSAYFDGKELVVAKPYPVEAVDTTAAGDTYIGYLAASLSEGMAMASAMDFASAASALKCLKRGAQGSIPTEQETLRFLSSRK